METIVTKKYKSFDGKYFDSEEECQSYEEFYLTDEQLIQCFHFFHNKHENIGNIETARRPSDATHYFFEIERSENKQSIYLYEQFKSNDSQSKLCESYTYLGFIIEKNLDFVVLYDAVKGFNDTHYQGRTTYRIKEFYKFLDELKNK